MKCLRKILKSQAGQVLPMALVLLALGGFLVVPVISLMTTNLNATRQIDQANLELNAADAGVEEVMWHIQYEPGFQLPVVGGQHAVTVPQINGTTVTAVLERPSGQPFRITSTATSPGGHRTTVVCYLDITGGADVWDFALASLGGNITLSGNSEVEADEVDNGNVYSNGNISVGGNAEVQGDASAVGTITESANGDISGEQIEGAVPLTAPTIDTAAAKAEAQNTEACNAITCDTGGTCPNLCTPSGTITCSGTKSITGCSPPPTFNSPVCINGDLTISSNSPIFNAKLFVSGTLTITGNSASPTFNGPVKATNLTISSNSGTATFKDVLCVTGNVTVNGNSPYVIFEGKVSIGGTLSQSGNTHVSFGSESTCFIGGSLSISGNNDMPLGKILYVVGSITITGNADLTGGGRIFAETGNIQLAGNSALAAEDIPFIMAINGNVSLTGNNTTSAVIYAPEGSITLGGNSHLIGCAVGESVSGSGNSTVTYLMDLRDRDDLPGREEGGPGSGMGLTIRTYSIQ